jgi:phage-related protein
MADVYLRVVFFRTETGAEPVREWLKELNRDERKLIGEDIKTVQFGWPMGMPLVRKLADELWEIRSRLHQRTARVIITVQEDFIVLLHGFIKKSQKTPASDMKLTKRRLAQLKGQGS